MKRIEALNGYTIFEATKRDVKKYNVEEGYFYIYLSSDIRDFGLSNSEWDWEAGSLEEAESFCSGSNYAIAKELVEDRTTAASFEEIEEVEKLLDAGINPLEIEAMEELEETDNYKIKYETMDNIEKVSDWMDEKEARKQFEKMKKDTTCIWCELLFSSIEEDQEIVIDQFTRKVVNILGKNVLLL